MKIVTKTDKIFELLSKGNFICSNSNDRDEQHLFEILADEDNFEQLSHFFEAINYKLEKGNEYFYFSKVTESKADIERKLHSLLQWIDIFDFFKSYDNNFASGTQIAPLDIANTISVNALLKSKLELLRASLKLDDRMAYIDVIKSALKEMAKNGYAIEVSTFDNTYKILSAIHYLETMLNNIVIHKDVDDEIPK